MGLTPRQKKLLDFVRAHVRRHGFGPSFDEIAVAIGVRSKCTVSRNVDVLCRHHLLKRSFHDTRGLQPVQTQDYHLPNCLCARCDRERYLADLKIIQALQVAPPAALTHSGVVLTGLRPLSHARRLEWLGLQRKSSPRKAPPKMTPAQVG